MIVELSIQLDQKCEYDRNCRFDKSNPTEKIEIAHTN